MRPGMPGRRRAAYGDFVQLARAEWPLAISAVTVAIFVSIGDHLDSLLRVPLLLIVAFA